MGRLDTALPAGRQEPGIRVPLWLTSVEGVAQRVRLGAERRQAGLPEITLTPESGPFGEWPGGQAPKESPVDRYRRKSHRKAGNAGGETQRCIGAVRMTKRPTGVT